MILILALSRLVPAERITENFNAPTYQLVKFCTSVLLKGTSWSLQPPKASQSLLQCPFHFNFICHHTLIYFYHFTIRSAVRLSASRMPRSSLETIISRSWLRVLWVRYLKRISTGIRAWSWLHSPNLSVKVFIRQADLWLSLQCSWRADRGARCVVCNFVFVQSDSKQSRDVFVSCHSSERWRCVSMKMHPSQFKHTQINFESFFRTKRINCESWQPL